MDKFIKIDIPFKSHLANLIKAYVATFDSVTNFRCESLTSGEIDTLDLEINFGINVINYLYDGNKYDIIIDYKEMGEPVGTYFAAEKLEKLTLMIEYEDDYFVKKNVIEQFVKNAKNFYNKKDENEIVCKILKGGYWSVLSRLPKRSMDTIYLSESEKNKIVSDLEKFKKSKLEYTELGIPWKRNYLLEGPPGTGKSSLIFALASKFNMNIHIINLGPKVDDSAFMSAVSNLPNNTILLLEDIDALFVERKANDSNKSMVSFSGILNVLDGMARKNGLITFMTTNYINRLDKALIRPSRVDLILRFKSATKDQIKQMFEKFFKGRSDFEKFYQKIEHIKFSICAIQKFFMQIKFNSEDIEKDLFDSNLLKDIINETENKKEPPEGMYV